MCLSQKCHLYNKCKSVDYGLDLNINVFQTSELNNDKLLPSLCTASRD